MTGQEIMGVVLFIGGGWVLGDIIRTARQAEAKRQQRRLRGPPKPPPPPPTWPRKRKPRPMCRWCGTQLNPIHFKDECAPSGKVSS